jgi:hypothetical protein
MDDSIQDEWERPDVALGCLAAVLAPASAVGVGALFLSLELGFAALAIAVVAFLWAIIVAGFHVLLFGLPAYALVRRFTVPGWWLCGACGALIGAAPLLLLALANGHGAGDLAPVLVFGVMGLIGGISFRWRLYPK